MPLPIQRLPRGLSETLSIFGGVTPRELEERVRGCVELTQFYGLQSYVRQLGSDAALAQGGTINLVVPNGQFWLLYDLGMNIVLAGGVTANHVSFALGPSGSETAIWGSSFANGVAATYQDGLTFAYPRLILPGWRLQLRLNALVGIANTSVAFSAGVGVLG